MHPNYSFLGRVWLPLIENPDIENLYREHYSSVLAFFIHKGFPYEEAEELTQETFLRVYRFKESFQGKGSFRSWLFSIAKNQWKNRIRDFRSQKRDAVVVSLNSPTSLTQPLPEVPPEQPNPLDQMIHAEKREHLQDAISQLPQTSYACVVLRVYQELSYEEIAIVLQVPRETVKSRLYQAQKKLKQILGEFMNVDLSDVDKPTKSGPGERHDKPES